MRVFGQLLFLKKAVFKIVAFKLHNRVYLIVHVYVLHKLFLTKNAELNAFAYSGIYLGFI